MIEPAPKSQYIRLETTGRKSGLPHIVELRYAALDDSFYFLPGNKDSDWVQNALHAHHGTVRSDDAVFEASASPGTEAEKQAARNEFVRKYGRRVVDRWYKTPAICLRLTPTGPPRLRRTTSGEFDVRTTYAQWAESKGDYYAEVGRAFDLASEEYDFTISHNFINTWIRERSIGLLLKYTRPDDTLLEIGSGTGAEAMEISGHVRRIVATDVSQRMVELLSAKATARNLSTKIIPLRLVAADIYKVAQAIEPDRLRLAYSFNGALNCEPRLGGFVDGIHSLLEPGGYFICSVRNTVCLGEMLSHALVLQFDRATPRKKQPVMVSVGGTDIPSTYYSALGFVQFFKPKFKAVRVIALPALLPPAYLNSYYLRARGGLSLLERLEPFLSPRFPFNLLGDQTLVVFQKVAT